MKTTGIEEEAVQFGERIVRSVYPRPVAEPVPFAVFAGPPLRIIEVIEAPSLLEEADGDRRLVYMWIGENIVARRRDTEVVGWVSEAWAGPDTDDRRPSELPPEDRREMAVLSFMTRQRCRGVSWWLRRDRARDQLALGEPHGGELVGVEWVEQLRRRCFPRDIEQQR